MYGSGVQRLAVMYLSRSEVMGCTLKEEAEVCLRWGFGEIIYNNGIEAWIVGTEADQLADTDSERLWNWKQGYQHKVRHGREVLEMEKGGESLSSRRKWDEMD